MPATDRKPSMPMQSRQPHSIRYTDAEWQDFIRDAVERGVEVTKWVRRCSIAGRSFIKTHEVMEEHRRATA